MSNIKLHTGIWALLLTLIIVLPILIANASTNFLDNLTDMILIGGFFFSMALLVEISIRHVVNKKETHPVTAQVMVLLSTTLMLFFFVGLTVR